MSMHIYRTHTCNELRHEHVGQNVRLSGWVHRKRDHGHLLFIDLRDHYGLTQCVIEADAQDFVMAESVRVESVVTITGRIVQRTPETVNAKMATGDIELVIESFKIDSMAEVLPLLVNSDQEFPEETRLRYRFLDLRREKIHSNIVLRSNIISSFRRRMIEQGFMEFQTPILTSSSPEGARDILVPSRMHLVNRIDDRNLLITQNAIKRLSFLFQHEMTPQRLRLRIDNGGCSGFQYNFSFDLQADADDFVFHHESIEVVIDDVSLGLIAGSQIDYVEDMMSAAFIVSNPNATASCGCGNSFSVF